MRRIRRLIIGGSGYISGIGGIVDNPPSSLTLANTVVQENAANGTLVGTAVGVDDGVLVYSLLDDAGGRFTIDPVTGEITVLDGSLLDFELSQTHSITVRVTDTNSVTLDVTFVISISDVEEVDSGDPFSDDTFWSDGTGWVDGDGSGGGSGSEDGDPFSDDTFWSDGTGWEDGSPTALLDGLLFENGDSIILENDDRLILEAA